MCGIAGIFQSENIDQYLLTSMGQTMKNRGPDDIGYYNQQGIGAVHRRLSIIDLSSGRQPIWNEDRTSFVICNGEIYDYEHHRHDLEKRGHRFSTQSDSEVILHLYEEHGPDMLQRINGMFAFAIFTPNSREIFIARDRLGQKPLFYTCDAPDSQHFAFASGPKALSKIPWANTTIDNASIHHLLEYQYIPQPRSIYTGISKLPPGHYLHWESGKTILQSYWQLPTPTSGIYDENELAEKTDYLLNKAVKRRLVADVKVGTFLSGGLDSSIISQLASSHASSALTTLSIGFPVSKYDESKFAEEVARHINSNHISKVVNPDDFGMLDTLADAYEEPFADASMLPTYLLCQMAKRHVTVALSGDGADELFGGYDRYNIIRKLQSPTGKALAHGAPIFKLLGSMLPPKTEERTFFGKIQRLLEIMPLDGLDQYLRLISRFPQSDRLSLYTDEFKTSVINENPLSTLQDSFPHNMNLRDHIDALEVNTYLPGDILTKVDRASMAHGLEVRSPFLDVEVVEFAMSLPLDVKMKQGIRKRLLTKAFGSRLPSVVSQRPKMGFGVPLARWMRESWKAPLQERLLDGSLIHHGFQRDGLSSYLTRHAENKADNSYGLFALAILESWLRQNA